MTSAEEVEIISEKLEVIIYLDDNPKINDLLETTATLLRTLLRERDEALAAQTLMFSAEEMHAVVLKIKEARSKALDEAAKVVRFNLGLHFEDVAKAILSLKDTQT